MTYADYMCQEKVEEDSFVLRNASIWLEDYIKKPKEILITAASNSTDNIRTNRTTIKTWKQKWEEKQLYGYFKRHTGKISHLKDLDMALKEKP